MKRLKLGEVVYPFYMSMLHIEKWCAKNKIRFSQLGEHLDKSPVSGVYSLISYGVDLGIKKEESELKPLTVEDLDEFVGMDQSKMEILTEFIGAFLGGSPREEETEGDPNVETLPE